MLKKTLRKDRTDKKEIFIIEMFQSRHKCAKCGLVISVPNSKHLLIMKSLSVEENSKSHSLGEYRCSLETQ